MSASLMRACNGVDKARSRTGGADDRGTRCPLVAAVVVANFVAKFVAFYIVYIL
jgi:hypothetical protein